MEITTGRDGNTVPSTVDGSGRFEAPLNLAMGRNTFNLRSTDPAGNVSQSRTTIVRSATDASIDVTISPTEVERSSLPVRLQITATVHDEDGRRVDDVPVVLSLSPPNLPTTQRRVLSADGVVRWTGIDIPAAPESVGSWLVTALATLPSGVELRDDATLTVPRSP
jgi:hypothetical protein